MIGAEEKEELRDRKMTQDIEFKCNCATVIAATKALNGESTPDDLRKALQCHENHACPDFSMILFDILPMVTASETKEAV